MCRERTELKFHLITTAVVIAAGFFFGITRTEWIVIILCIGVVIAAELFNTAIEKLVDLVSPERHPIAAGKRHCRRSSTGVRCCGGNYRDYYFSPVFKLRGRGKELG